MSEKFKVVISGMSGRFPECDDVDLFKEKLYNGDEFITTDNRKWPVGFRHKMVAEKMVTDATGKLLNVHKFDQTVFKMSASWALGYDVINRLSLEPSFEAIVDAGINPYSLDGRNICVFMSTANNEATRNLSDRNIIKSALTILGTNKNMLSNRISYFLNLRGPSVTYHIDVHGGLESLAMGYKLVSQGFAEAAIVGAVSSIVDPRMSLQYASINILSPDGTTQPFDEWAKGHGRSEGVVCFYLQRAEDAKRNYGEIKFCDFQYFGSTLSNFICYEEAYVKETLQHLFEVNNFDLTAPDIDFVEMNAYGQKLMDTIESNAVAELLSKGRKDPLLVGSIKSNIGQAEAAAGFMSVLKAIFALDSGILAPNKHLREINAGIRAFERNALKVVTKKTPLLGSKVAVTSLGLCGSVGLAVIEKHENRSARTNASTVTLPRILLICGRDGQDLLTKITRIERLPFNAEFISLANDAFRQNMPAHIHRGYTILPPHPQPVHSVQTRADISRPVWLVFSGMGSQWNGMGKVLLRLPVFADTMVRCDQVLRQKGIDIYYILTSGDPALFENMVNAFVGITAVQLGLYEVVKVLGIEPDGIVGHSVGENGCAYADGCLSLEEAMLASWSRAVIFTKYPTTDGLMAVVGKGNAEMLGTLPEGIYVACHNSKDNCTLTGPTKLVNAYAQTLQAEGIFVKTLKAGNVAPHSPYIAPLGPKFMDALNSHVFVGTEPRRRSSKWISTSVPESEWHTPLAQFCSAEYLTANLLGEVLFEEACAHIPENAICIELAPHGLLQSILRRSLPATCTNVSLTNRWKTQDGLTYLLSAVGKLYIAGLEPRVNDIFPAVEYPVPRGTPSLAPYCAWYRSDERIPYHLVNHFKEDHPVSRDSIPICIKEDSEYAYLRNHKINGDVTLPMSFFMHLVWRVFSFRRMEKVGSSPIIFGDLKMHSQVLMSVRDIKYAFVMLQYGSGNFQVTLQDEEDSCDFQIILTGRIELMTDEMKTHLWEVSCKNGEIVSKSQLRNIFGKAGYELKDDFSLPMNKLHRQNTTEYEAEIIWNENWVAFLDTLMKVQMFVDRSGNVKDILPVRLRRIEIWTPKFSSLKKGTSLRCRSDAASQELVCPGITMNSLKYKVYKTVDESLNPLIDGPRSIFENGECRKYRNLYADVRDENDKEPMEIDHVYLDGENTNRSTLSVSEKILHFSYAASSTNGKKRIGLASISSTTGWKYDQHLYWTAYNRWSSEEAAAIPYIYAQAYNLLNPQFYDKAPKTVMINIGAEYLLAEAVLVLAYHKNQTVFVIVRTNDEVLHFKKKFPQLDSSQIFYSQNYEMPIRERTKFEGVDLVINCSPGNQHVNACLGCVKKFGYYTEVGQENCRDEFEIGMFDFGRYTSMRVIQNSISDLLRLPVATKVKMRKFLQECMSEGKVVPPRTRALGASTPSSEQIEISVQILKGEEFERHLCENSPEIFPRQVNHKAFQPNNKKNGVLREATGTNSIRKSGINGSRSRHILDYIPSDIKILCKIGQDKVDECKFFETSSLSRRYAHCRGVYPIFALPAVHSSILEPLFRRLLYPVFTLTSAPASLTEGTVHKLYQSLSQIQPSGPVTIVSETWTVHLALELASHLQLQKRKYRIFAMESNPENWRELVERPQSFSSLKSVDVDEIFLNTINEQHFLRKSDSLAKKTNAHTGNGSRNSKMENILKALEKITEGITGLASASISDKLLHNVTLFERRCPANEALRLSVTSDVVLLNEQNYSNMLTSPRVSRIINEKAEYSWWEYTQH